MRFLATFLAVGIGGASALLAAWAAWLLGDPHETVHFEIALPALALAALGFGAAALLWRRGR
ncbi:MAG TPA: hypothetical protein VNJ53_12310 [Gaiellaceae bacterium]|nr:hypothetical protein [Gaiellaceae bacterium]